MKYPKSEQLGWVKGPDGGSYALHFYGENEGAAVITGPSVVGGGTMREVPEVHREPAQDPWTRARSSTCGDALRAGRTDAHSFLRPTSVERLEAAVPASEDTIAKPLAAMRARATTRTSSSGVSVAASCSSAAAALSTAAT